MSVRPAKTQVSLSIDPLDKASFLDSPESKEGAYCTISEGSDQNVLLRCSRTIYPHSIYPALDSPAIKGKFDQRMLLSECAVGRLTRVFARRTRRFVKPRDCWRYIRLAKALIRLLMCRLRVCRLIHLFVQVLL